MSEFERDPGAEEGIRVTDKRVIDPQTAHTMVNIMTADTKSSYGTAGRYFGNWYARGGSLVAAKTGTDNDNTTKEESGGNSALWFVGMTPTPS